MRRFTRVGGPVLAAVGVLAAAACGGGHDVGDGGAGGGVDSVAGTVTVLAAASLTAPFEQLADRLEAEHGGLEVAVSFGPSSGLVEQVLAGAPADVLATADARTMEVAVAGGAVAGDPVVFARNTLVLAVPAGNPGGVTGLADLAREELRIALCEPQVPCGAAAERLLERAGVAARPDTLESDVKDVAGKVILGEVDAALVYRTDVAELESVEIVEVPGTDQVANEYLVAAVAGSANAVAAQAVVEGITGALGREVLATAGFLLP